MLSSCLKLLLRLSLFVILTECMPKTQFTEDDSDLVDIGDDKPEDYDSNNDGHDESGNLTTDAPDNQKDDESEVNNTTDLTEDGENDKADEIKEEEIKELCSGRRRGGDCIPNDWMNESYETTKYPDDICHDKINSILKKVLKKLQMSQDVEMKASEMVEEMLTEREIEEETTTEILGVTTTEKIRCEGHGYLRCL